MFAFVTFFVECTATAAPSVVLGLSLFSSVSCYAKLTLDQRSTDASACSL